MDVQVSEEQRQLAESLRRSLRSWWPTAALRDVLAADATGHSADLWARLAAGGWLEVAIPTSDGDDPDEPGVVEAGLVFFECGRALVPTTFGSTVFAGLLIDRLGTAEQRDLLDAIRGGTLVATVADAEPGVEEDLTALATTARAEADAWLLEGEKSFVPNWETAGIAVVPALVGDERQFGLFLVSTDAPGVASIRQSTFGKDAQSRLTLTGVSLDGAALLGGALGDAAEAAYRAARDAMAAFAAMEMAGGTRAVLDQTADYVTQRIAFNRPIGGFQAVQHALADVAIALKGTELAALRAVWALSEVGDCRREVSMAKAWAGKTFRNATLTAHQLWGGMGYMRETDLHLWSNRAVALDARYGGYSQHVTRLAASIAPTGAIANRKEG